MYFIQIKGRSQRFIIVRFIYIVFWNHRSNKCLLSKTYFTFTIVTTCKIFNSWFLILASWRIFWKISRSRWFTTWFEYCWPLRLMIQWNWHQHLMVFIVNFIIAIVIRLLYIKFLARDKKLAILIMSYHLLLLYFIILRPLAFINRTIYILHFSISLSKIILIISFINTTFCPCKHSFAMLLII